MTIGSIGNLPFVFCAPLKLSYVIEHVTEFEERGSMLNILGKFPPTLSQFKGVHDAKSSERIMRQLSFCYNVSSCS